MEFELITKDINARRGRVITEHGKIETPVFMPVGTKGTVKTVSPCELEQVGAEIILGNTYHLYLRPGTKLIKKFGGIQKFANWGKPVLTDSGGYQVFSLSQGKRGQGRLAKVTENGVEFTSYLDGSKHLFTPENVIDSQLDIGADIIMPLDFCPSAEENYQEIERAVNITNDWFAKAFNHFVKQPEAKNTALFAIIQGGTYPELRKKAYEYLRQFSVQGFSIGGVANAGESKEKQKAALDATLPLLPEDKPRYLMGVGEPEDLLIGVEAGVDMFDCVTPTRLGRHGVIYTKKGKINLLNVKYRADKSILDEDCDCPACQGFAKGYVSHLLRENEVLGIRLTTLHNLRFLLRLMEDVRISIDNGRFKTFKKSFLKEYLDKTV